MTEREENEVWLDKKTAEEIKKIQKYLGTHKVTASRTEIISTAILLAKRLGAGDWTFVCEFKEGERRKEEKDGFDE